jgi:hypothetical protein
MNSLSIAIWSGQSWQTMTQANNSLDAAHCGTIFFSQKKKFFRAILSCHMGWKFAELSGYYYNTRSRSPLDTWLVAYSIRELNTWLAELWYACLFWFGFCPSMKTVAVLSKQCFRLPNCYQLIVTASQRRKVTVWQSWIHNPNINPHQGQCNGHFSFSVLMWWLDCGQSN